MKPADAPRRAPCPNCGQPASLSGDNGFRPFCSRRCQQLDFGGWIEERYTIAEQPDPLAPPDDAEPRG